jgi:hypothetical protein
MGDFIHLVVVVQADFCDLPGNFVGYDLQWGLPKAVIDEVKGEVVGEAFGVPTFILFLL